MNFSLDGRNKRDTRSLGGVWLSPDGETAFLCFCFQLFIDSVLFMNEVSTVVEVVCFF